MALTRVINSGIGVAASIAGEATASTNLQQGLAKVWCDIDQSGSNTFQDSFNTSSIADTATGQSTVNIANDMASGNYCNSTGSSSPIHRVPNSLKATGSFRVDAEDSNFADDDAVNLGIALHGDLA